MIAGKRGSGEVFWFFGFKNGKYFRLLMCCKESYPTELASPVMEGRPSPVTGGLLVLGKPRRWERGAYLGKHQTWYV